MVSVTFLPAKKNLTKLKIAITGTAGSGKTHSALLMAGGIAEKIAVLDTENGSSNLEVGKKDVPQFDVVTMNAPYLTEKYLATIDSAIEGGYDLLIIDSLSHGWAGTGGLLEQKENIDKAKKGNSYTNWATITKKQNELIAKIISANIHIIVTMRSKSDYILTENEKGYQVPKKIGLAPVQREGVDYEFTTVFDLDQQSHLYSVSKDRTSLFDGFSDKITKATGEKFLAWLNS